MDRFAAPVSTISVLATHTQEMSYNLRCTQNSFVSGVHLMIPLLKKASRLIITCKETGKARVHNTLQHFRLSVDPP